MAEFSKSRLTEELSKFERVILERLERNSFIDIGKSYNGVNCKRFAGATTSDGYGCIGFLGKTYLVHRVSASLLFEFDLNSELFVCHHCDVRDCWEPSHLFPGTNIDNLQDASSKGRISKASHNGHKTHCPQGHEYSLSNTKMDRGSRRCITCTSERERRRIR